MSISALSRLPSDSKTVMIANTRRTGEAWGIYYRAKGPLVCLSASLTDWLAGWLVGSASVLLLLLLPGPPQQSLAELLKPAPGPQPAACLLYTINLCSLEMVQGCREALRHNCPARLPSYSNSKVGEGSQKEGGMNGGRG